MAIHNWPLFNRIAPRAARALLWPFLYHINQGRPPGEKLSLRGDTVISQKLDVGDNYDTGFSLAFVRVAPALTYLVAAVLSMSALLSESIAAHITALTILLIAASGASYAVGNFEVGSPDGTTTAEVDT